MKCEDLAGKNILVTGGNRGIGRSLCEGLAKQGATVIFSYRSNDEEAAALITHLESLGGKAVAAKFDVTNLEQTKEALGPIIEEHGAISGLVNNAGISKDQMVLRLKEQDLEQILQTNLMAPIKLTSFLSRQFLKAESVSIVNISSIVGLMGNAGQVSYSASKAGLIGFTKSYAKELASRKIRCNAVCPGFIRTDMTDELNEDVKNAYLSSIPLGEFGEPEDVSNLVNFLLSSSSKYITGEVFKIDGGLYI